MLPVSLNDPGPQPQMASNSGRHRDLCLAFDARGASMVGGDGSPFVRTSIWTSFECALVHRRRLEVLFHLP